MKNDKNIQPAAEAVTLTTLCREASAEFEEKKSVFIGHAMPVETEEEALALFDPGRRAAVNG